jgi:ankyrin repeat protein
MGRSQELLQQAIAADDVAAANALVDADATLLDAPLAGGAGPVLLAMYLGKRALAVALAQRKSGLAVPEAAALGDLRALQATLALDPAQAQARSGDGFPALGLAVYFGHVRCAALLLAAGADPDAAADNPMRVAPIHSACAQADEALARRLLHLLLAFAVDLDARQQAGWTALHAAAHRDYAELIAVLRGAGADPQLRNDADHDAVDIARSEGKDAALAALMS